MDMPLDSARDKPATITVETVVRAPIAKVWGFWNKPEHITKWAFASDDWEAPAAENDLRAGGKFKTRMQAKNPPSPDSSGVAREGFDFTGTYTNVKEHEFIEYDMDAVPPSHEASADAKALADRPGEAKRHVKVTFAPVPTPPSSDGSGGASGVKITETFDPEHENTEEMQRSGWQAILDNFKKYAEGKIKYRELAIRD